MKPEGDINGAVGLGEVAVRAEKKAHGCQSKSLWLVGHFLSSLVLQTKIQVACSRSLWG